jgi:hypothetical protein
MAIYVTQQHLPLQDPPKSTQSGIFGVKICHLATLIYKQLIATLEYKILKSVSVLPVTT